MKVTSNIRYAMYARKSSEADDKQVLSIDSQVSELQKVVGNKKIILLDEDVMHESHSAKQAYSRPVFEQLIKDIEQRKIQGVIAWHPNRLSRNAIDAARLIELMDQGKLAEIITPGQTYRNSPQDKFFFGMLTSQAKMENDAKGVDVMRGLRKKNEMGFPAGVAKVGYINDYGMKGQRRIKVDPERFELVKQLWELFLTGKYSVRKLLKYSDEVLGIRTIQRSKEGGKPIQLSRIYDMLKDPFPAGFFYGKDENGEQKRYEVHESIPRMITEEQYWQIQAMLGRKGVPCPSVNKNIFPYVGRTKCGSCGGNVTAEHKYQLICPGCKHKFAYPNKTVCPMCNTKISDMTDPVYLHYIYYHCTKRKDSNCPGRSVQGKFIDDKIASHVEDNLEISKSLSEWCISNLNELTGNDQKNEFERKSNWTREKKQKEKEYDELVRMKMKGLIDDDNEFLRLKASLNADMVQIDKNIAANGEQSAVGIEEIRKAFNLVVGVAEVFRTGTFDEKQEALSALGSNLTLKDKKLNIINKEMFEVVSSGLLRAKTLNRAFEPRKCQADKDETEVFASVRPTLLRG